MAKLAADVSDALLGAAVGVVTRRDCIRQLMLPWAGWIGGASGWVLTHQFGSYLNFDHCGTMGPLLALLIGLIGLGIAAVGFLLSRRAYRNQNTDEAALHFVSLIGMLFALLLAVAIVFQTLSSLFIPRCYG
jgi:hypothetical protein